MPPRRDEATIFNVARRIGSAEARGVYLTVACGDDAALHRRIEALLRVHDESAAPLTSPTCVKKMRGDLDRIVLNCLENDQAGRYGSAEDLAQDIERQAQSSQKNAHWLTQLVRKLRRAFS
jgi:hypothetical protein